MWRFVCALWLVKRHKISIASWIFWIAKTTLQENDHNLTIQSTYTRTSTSHPYPCLSTIPIPLPQPLPDTASSSTSTSFPPTSFLFRIIFFHFHFRLLKLSSPRVVHPTAPHLLEVLHLFCVGCSHPHVPEGCRDADADPVSWSYCRRCRCAHGWSPQHVFRQEQAQVIVLNRLGVVVVWCVVCGVWCVVCGVWCV